MVLDASGNDMGGTEIEPLLDLYRLETLNLADNDIEEMAQVRRIVTEGCFTFHVDVQSRIKCLLLEFKFQQSIRQPWRSCTNSSL